MAGGCWCLIQETGGAAGATGTPTGASIIPALVLVTGATGATTGGAPTGAPTGGTPPGGTSPSTGAPSS